VIGWSAYTENTSGATVKTEPSAPASGPTRGANTDTTQIQVNWAQLTGDATG